MSYFYVCINKPPCFYQRCRTDNIKGAAAPITSKEPLRPAIIKSAAIKGADHDEIMFNSFICS